MGTLEGRTLRVASQSQLCISVYIVVLGSGSGQVLPRGSANAVKVGDRSRGLSRMNLGILSSNLAQAASAARAHFS